MKLPYATVHIPYGCPLSPGCSTSIQLLGPCLLLLRKQQNTAQVLGDGGGPRLLGLDKPSPAMWSPGELMSRRRSSSLPFQQFEEINVFKTVVLGRRRGDIFNTYIKHLTKITHLGNCNVSTLYVLYLYWGGEGGIAAQWVKTPLGTLAFFIRGPAGSLPIQCPAYMPGKAEYSPCHPCGRLKQSSWHLALA